MSEENLLQELDQSFILPERVFKGQRLAPYTEGSRLLMLQVRDDADTPIFFVYAFIFIHILLAKSRKEAIRLAWNRDEFREKLMEWSENMTDDDRDKASIMVAAILGESNKARVNVIPSGIPAPPGNE